MEEKLAKKVRSCWHSVQVKEGDIIIAKGDACEAIYVLHEGEVGMFKECEAQKSPVGEAHPTEDKFESLSLDMHLHTIQLQKHSHRMILSRVFDSRTTTRNTTNMLRSTLCTKISITKAITTYKTNLHHQSPENALLRTSSFNTHVRAFLMSTFWIRGV